LIEKNWRQVSAGYFAFAAAAEFRRPQSSRATTTSRLIF
jgi:hypothetical protein